jgi:CheY-specific phosphatase CheX
VFSLPYRPPSIGQHGETAYQQAGKLLAPLPRAMQTLCGQHLKLEVSLETQQCELTADNLHDFTALVSLGSGLNAAIGLSVERPLLLEMTRRFEPDFPEEEIADLADSVGAEIANTLVGNATVYYTHLAHQVAMGTPQMVDPAQRGDHFGKRAFHGYRGQAEAGAFTVFCVLSEETSV